MRKSLLGVVLLLMAGVGCTRINPSHVGIVVDMAGTHRGVQDYTTTTGWVFYNPFTTSIMEYPTYVQTYVWTAKNSEGDESFTFNTNGGMTVNVDVNLSYQLDSTKVPAFYVKFRTDDITQFTFGYLHNVTRDCFTSHGGKYTVDQLMSNVQPLLDDVRGCVQDGTKDLGVQIQSFGLIGSPRPPQQIIEAINAKMQAQQIALKVQNEVLTAQAEAQKRVAQAEGEAKAHIAQADGEAQANKKLTESLTPQLLEWRRLAIQDKAVDRWHGDVPSVMTGAGGGLLFNLPVNSKQ